MKKLIILTSAVSIFFLTGCKKDNVSSKVEDSADKPAAFKIAGLFNGTGKQLADGIFLGNYKGCIVPAGWENNFMIGQSAVNISKMTDSTISMTLSGGPFLSATYSNIVVTETGSTIIFGFGRYDENTEFLSFSRNTASLIYTPSPSCLQGMPYYSGGSILNDGNYSYYTHGRADFSGTKQ